jgi:hypothetical protein
MKAAGMRPNGQSLDWHRTTKFCHAGECVEIAEAGDDVIFMRSSTRDSEYAQFTRDAFECFLIRAKSGEFDKA